MESLYHALFLQGEDFFGAMRGYVRLLVALVMAVASSAFFTAQTAKPPLQHQSNQHVTKVQSMKNQGEMLSPSTFLQFGAGAATKSDVQVTFLESNSWLWQIQGVNILVDPVMYTLDFGVPSLIQAKKTVVDGDKALKDASKVIDWVLISQGFDDHAHPATLEKLRELVPDVKIIAPPSAEGVLSRYFPSSQLVLLSPGQSFDVGKVVKGKCEKPTIKVVATRGDTLGPPWQAPENGYILQFNGSKVSSLYYEPHCRFYEEDFKRDGLKADVVITPVIQQNLFGLLPVVDGQMRAVKLAEALKAKVVVPMNNGDLDISESSWAFQKLVKKGGTIKSFLQLLKDNLPGVKFTEAPAGVSVPIVA